MNLAPSTQGEGNATYRKSCLFQKYSPFRLDRAGDRCLHYRGKPVKGGAIEAIHQRTTLPYYVTRQQRSAPRRLRFRQDRFGIVREPHVLRKLSAK